LAARCSNDLTVRRKIDAVVYEVRKQMAPPAMADKNGETLRLVPAHSASAGSCSVFGWRIIIPANRRDAGC
jgi:hypothetical protein